MCRSPVLGMQGQIVLHELLPNWGITHEYAWNLEGVTNTLLYADLLMPCRGAV